MTARTFRLDAPLFAIGLRIERRADAPGAPITPRWVEIDAGGYLQPGALIRMRGEDLIDASTDNGVTWYAQRIEPNARIMCTDVTPVSTRYESGL